MASKDSIQTPSDAEMTRILNEKIAADKLKKE